ncbi:hypothetical protein [Corynebacterium ulceribovis]|uniref:GAP1-N2 domain-containing protein n=1 Tax=Corynebacterium ulceribovis TaxID=487732 RepID=UPI0003714B3B|nr:hypothetical protein [Corynebacterium ulceribovis]
MNCSGFFTYASFSKGGRGGWQVGQSDGLSDSEIEALLKWTPTQIDTGIPLPKYPSNEQVTQFIRRTAWLDAPWGQGDKALFYSTPAGEDASGRQGNVFSQVYVFRNGDAPHFRPSDLLASPDFAQVFGAVAVNTHTVTMEQCRVQPGPLADTAAVAEWLYPETDPAAGQHRRELLMQIMDALEAKQQVAICGDLAEAAAWIAALNTTLAPANAVKLSWSTLERARGLDHATAKKLQLVFLPDADFAEAQSNRQWTTFRTHDQVTATETQSPWAQLAQLVLRNQADFQAAANQQVPVQGAQKGWMLANYLAENPYLLSDASSQVTALVQAAEAHSPFAGASNPYDDHAPALDSFSGQFNSNVFDIGESAADPLESSAGLGNPWGETPPTNQLAAAEVPAWSYEDLEAVADHYAPLPPIIRGRRVEWWEVADILRLSAHGAEHADVLASAQHHVLITAAAFAAQMGRDNDVRMLPWWRVAELSDADFGTVAASVRDLVPDVSAAQYDQLIQQPQVPDGLRDILRKCQQ